MNYIWIKKNEKKIYITYFYKKYNIFNKMNEYDILLSKSKLLEDNLDLPKNEYKQINIKTKSVRQIIIERLQIQHV